MPLVPAGVAGNLAGQLGNAYAALPVHDGKPGHPVLLSARAIQDAEQLEGDFGAGKLLRGRDDVVRLEWSDARVLADVDRPEDLRSLSSR
jgi:molybdenum cofactor cytidylyltransferase